MRWLMVPILGAALGTATSASDVAAGGMDQTPVDRAVSMVLNAGFVWAGAAVLAGWLLAERRLARTAVAGICTLLTAVLAYYTYGVLIGDRAAGGLDTVSGMVRLWAGAALVVGPVLGALGALCRSTGLPGVLARLVVPSGAIFEMVVLRGLDEESFRVDPVLARTQAAIVAIAALSILAAVVAARRRSTPGRT